MSTRTIEPIHIVLPDADGGYYRFGDLPRLIADALYPEHPDDEAQELQWMKHAIDGVEKYKRDLARAAGLADGEPGYLHVVENSASKRPLEWRIGAVLNAGLVHLDWLNEWGESRKPPHVFSTASAPEPQAATPAPVADSASSATETKEQRQDRRLQACIDAGLPMDTRAALSRLPDGVGDVADLEGVTRQAFSTDVKAALKRRESAIREGATVHRA